MIKSMESLSNLTALAKNSSNNTTYKVSITNGHYPHFPFLPKKVKTKNYLKLLKLMCFINYKVTSEGNKNEC